jgi:two-component system, NtrC family, nitrogen regulation sensor histidine kinase NtrY
MSFKNFRLNIVFRVLMIVVSTILFIALIARTGFIISSIILASLVILQFVLLVKYVERTNRRLTTFLESIRHSDFISTFSDQGLGKSFDELNAAFNEVINEFKKTRASREEHFNYLQTVVQHINIGIIVFQRHGKVDIFNNASKRMLKITTIRFIKELEKVDNNLAEVIMEMKAGDTNLVKVFIDNELLQLSVRATEFRMRKEDFVLVSLQNIHSELEAKEMDSWQKLIRVLTHEIMNSITPIVSLSGTVKDILIDDETLELRREIDDDDVEGVLGALATIEKRSQGLLNFVQIYRNLTRIPKPNFRYVEVKEIVETVTNLLEPKFREEGISCRVHILPKDLKFTVDPDLIEQVMINLVINAVHAIKDTREPEIKIIAGARSNNRVTISVCDNGHGIKPDNMEKIFVPFFTSKKEGSGIGLSLSREIMRMHKGSITVKSNPGEETIFTLYF